MSDKELIAAFRVAVFNSARATQARASLPAGSSRARVTTANARWMRAAEHRDRLLAEMESRGLT